GERAGVRGSSKFEARYSESTLDSDWSFTFIFGLRMGTVFPLIADNALQPADAKYYLECQVCRDRNVPVYPCQGRVCQQDGSAELRCEVYVACEHCLKQGRIIHIGERRTDPVIEKFAKDPVAEKARLRATPRIPLQMQGTDWPLCCGRLTEFIGSPLNLEELILVQADGVFWDRRPDSSLIYDARIDGPPESFDEVSVFHCLICGKKYWIFQPT
ncbi:MAG TPA: hypothetical protein VGJ15_13875, partial [Pirellulales bacterium]